MANIKQLFKITLFSSIVYVIFWFILRIEVSEKTLFSTPDSVSYLNVSNWLFYNSYNNSYLIRPFLYPVFISIFYNLFGSTSFWFAQFIVWLITSNVVYFTSKRIFGNQWMVLFVWLLFVFNISLIAMTFHALTEVVTTFLLSLFVYFITKIKKKEQVINNIFKIVFLLSLLTVIKPVFWYLYLISIVVLIFSIRGTSFKHIIKHTITLLIFSSPIILQLFLFKNQTGEFKISKIGEKTFKNYFLSQLYADINKQEIDSVRIKVNELNKEDVASLIYNNKTKVAENLFLNIKENIISPSTFTFYSIKKPAKFAYYYSKTTNQLYFLFHIVFLFLFIFNVYCMILNSNFKFSYIAIGIAFYYFLMLTGISFWQGDRLVLPTICIWPIFYCISWNIAFNEKPLSLVNE